MLKILVVLAIAAQAAIVEGCLTCRVIVCWPHPSCPAVDFVQTFLPHADCGKFYKCDKGIKCEMSCPAGLHWSVHLVRCEWPHIARCDPTIPNPTPPAPIPTIPITTPPAPITTTPAPIPTIPITTTPAPITTTPAPIPTIPVTTTPAPFTTTPAPIPVTTTPAPITTTPAPIPVTTTPAPITTTPAPIPTIPITTTPAPAPVPTTVGPSPNNCIDDSRCPTNENPNQPTSLPHESDCGRFYKCSLGQRCPLSCPLGQHFSVTLQRCDWPNIACCDPRVPCIAVIPTTVNTTPNSAQDCKPDIGCPQNDNAANPMHLPNPSSCSSFYKCQMGQACLIPCPQGQHWSRQLNRCEWPAVACCDAALCRP